MKAERLYPLDEVSLERFKSKYADVPEVWARAHLQTRLQRRGSVQKTRPILYRPGRRTR